MYAINKMFGISSNPHIIDGMVDGKTMLVVKQDPSVIGAMPIERSVNGPSGIEFAWTVWLFIENLEYQRGQYRHIFHKGEVNIESQGRNFPNNAPGLYIEPNTNNLCVIMNTQQVINKEITVTDIPLHKWFHVIIRCRNTSIDVYINGTVVKSVDLDSVPRQNFGNVYVGMNGGFDGYISNLWYFNTALGIGEINDLVRKGPDLKMNTGMLSVLDTRYLSTRWYYFGQNTYTKKK